MKAPAFQFYPDDFIGGTVEMTTEEVGSYIRLLCYQWGRGEIPSEAEKVERIAGGPVSADVIGKFPNGKNPRLEAEREKQEVFRKERAHSGAKGAASRWHGSANGSAIKEPMAKGMANDGSPSPSPSPSPISVPVTDSVPPKDVPSRKPSARGKLSDEDFVAALKANKAFEGIDVERELGKMQAWLLTPKGRGRQLTQGFVVNWLNKIDRPMNGSAVRARVS